MREESLFSWAARFATKPAVVRISCSPSFPLFRKGWGFCAASRGLHMCVVKCTENPQPLRKKAKAGLHVCTPAVIRISCSPSFPLFRKGWGFCAASRGLHVRGEMPRKPPAFAEKKQRLGYTICNQTHGGKDPFVAHRFRFSGKGGDFVQPATAYTCVVRGTENPQPLRKKAKAGLHVCNQACRDKDFL
jgi:hypothetical protein